MRVVLAPVGSRGDVQPMVALGQRLEGAGHDVTMVVAENFRPLVEGVGLSYVRGGGDVEAIVRSEVQGRLGNPFVFLNVVRGLIDEQFAALEAACEGADVLVGTLLQVAAPSVAERLAIPLLFASYFPASSPTAELPPALSNLAGGPAWLNRAAWTAQTFLVNHTLRGPVNRHRARLGLPQVDDLQRHAVERSGLLLATDAQLGPAPTDWTFKHHDTGFWYLDSPEPLPDDVEAFLAAGDPPVYIGFGSMPSVDPTGQTEVIAEACAALGCRALVSAGWANLGGGVTSSRIKTIGPVNHRLLFERVAAVVHHGGAGTTAATARAGVPQVVVPHIVDQFYWASRVEALGLGPPPIPTAFRSTALVRALRAALEDARMKSRAERMAERLRAYSGTDRAVAVLERTVAGVT